jgi:hypothetical protein
MPPNQNQFPAPQNSGDPEHDPYAFFMEPQKPSKGSLFGGGSNKLFIIAGAVVALLVIVVVIVMASSANKGKTDELLAVVQAQQEVIRVATDGTKNAHSTTLKNFANTTAVSLSSDQHQLLALMLKQGRKVSPKELDLGKNSQTDKALSTAQAANTYDTTFATTMDAEIEDYQNKLDAAQKVASSSAGITLLKKEVANAAQLSKELSGDLPTATP